MALGLVNYFDGNHHLDRQGLHLSSSYSSLDFFTFSEQMKHSCAQTHSLEWLVRCHCHCLHWPLDHHCFQSHLEHSRCHHSPKMAEVEVHPFSSINWNTYPYLIIFSNSSSFWHCSMLSMSFHYHFWVSVTPHYHLTCRNYSCLMAFFSENCSVLSSVRRSLCSIWKTEAALLDPQYRRHCYLSVAIFCFFELDCYPYLITSAIENSLCSLVDPDGLSYHLRSHCSFQIHPLRYFLFSCSFLAFSICCRWKKLAAGLGRCLYSNYHYFM